MRETPLVRRGRGSVSNITGRFEALRHQDIDCLLYTSDAADE